MRIGTPSTMPSLSHDQKYVESSSSAKAHTPGPPGVWDGRRVCRGPSENQLNVGHVCLTSEASKSQPSSEYLSAVACVGPAAAHAFALSFERGRL